MKATLPDDPARKQAASRRNTLLLAWAAQVVMLLAMFWGAQISKSFVDSNKQLRFTSIAHHIEKAITDRVHFYETLLRGGQGLFAARETPSGLEWHRYWTSIAVEERYPGSDGTGFIAYVPRAELPKFEAAARADGLPGFKVKPEVARDDCFPVRFVEPSRKYSPALGFDVGSQPALRAAAEEARDTGMPVSTEKITLVQGSEKTLGFLLLLPVFRDGAPLDTIEERRAALKGWVFGAFRSSEFMQDVLPKDDASLVQVTLFDGPKSTYKSLLYASARTNSPGTGGSPPTFKATLHLPVASRTWSLHLTTLPVFDAATRSNEPFLIYIGGVLASVLIFGLVWSLSTTRARALALAQSMTVALRESEAQTRALLDNVAEAIITYDERAMIRSVNPACERVFGHPPGDLLAKHLSVLLPRHQAALEAGHHSEVPARRKDGTALSLDMAVSEMRQEDVRIFISVARDTTERRKTAEALAQARDAALQSAKLKSEFLANMSHEIRTPMNGIIGTSELLQKSPLNEEQQEFAGTIHTCAEWLLKIINDILDFSKIEAGKLQIENVDFDLRGTVDAVLDLFAGTAQRKGLKLAAVIEPGVPFTLRGDPGRLRQVLTNLVGNAVKFTESGEVAVTVAVERESAANPVIRFTVRDTGIGLTDDAQSRLFQAFSQADGSTTRRYGGSGLGLAISKNLVELMGGTIGVESAPDMGSTFWFTVRFEAQFAGVAAPPAGRRPATRVLRPESVGHMYALKNKIPSVPPAAAKNPGAAIVRILVAEDNIVNQRVLTRQLTQAGYAVDVVGNGADACAALERTRYALALIDCQMPGMDGYEAAREIRRREGQSRRTPIIAITAHVLQGDRERCLDAGMDDYLGKPIKFDDLQTMLNHWLSRGTRSTAVGCPCEGEDASTLAADSKAASATPVDMSSLMAACGGDWDEMRELTELYFEQTTQRIKKLKNAIGAGDAREVDRLAHASVGSSATCGMPEITRLFQALETMGRESKLEGAAQLMEQVEAEFERINLFLQSAQREHSQT